MELILASVLQYRERWMGGFRLVQVKIRCFPPSEAGAKVSDAGS